jgi:hypothetical protein
MLEDRTARVAVTPHHASIWVVFVERDLPALHRVDLPVCVPFGAVASGSAAVPVRASETNDGDCVVLAWCPWADAVGYDAVQGAVALVELHDRQIEVVVVAIGVTVGTGVSGSGNTVDPSSAAEGDALAVIGDAVTRRDDGRVTDEIGGAAIDQADGWVTVVHHTTGKRLPHLARGWRGRRSVVHRGPARRRDQRPGAEVQQSKARGWFERLAHVPASCF